MNHIATFTIPVTPAPSAGTHSNLRTILARDPDELARNLTNWEQSYDQMSCGKFEGALAELQLPQVQLFRETISQSVRQTCRPWTGSIWFGFPQHTACTRINGRAADPNVVLLRSGGSEFELVTPSTYTIYGVVVPRTVLADISFRTGSTIDWDELEQAEVLKVDPCSRARFIHTLSALLGLEHSASAVRTGLSVQNRCQESLVTALTELIGQGQVDPVVARSFQRRQRVIETARSYVLTHRDQPISVPDLCEHAHVSRRTLQYCFEDILGVSPVTYLRIVRLNGARRQLLGTESGAPYIGDIAAQWGFNNFSQFSSDYRKLFGECASTSIKTFNRAAG